MKGLLFKDIGKVELIMEELIKMIEKGELDPLPLITHRMSLADAEKGFSIFCDRTEPVVKIALKP